MWHLKITIVSVIVGALGMIMKGTDKRINKILSSPSQFEIRKTALCKTAYLLRKVLSM